MVADGDGAGVAGRVTSRGLTIEKAFDGLVYREIMDVRGSSTDWEVAVVTARAGG